jgi:hypothetical protein
MLALLSWSMPVVIGKTNTLLAWILLEKRHTVKR